MVESPSTGIFIMVDKYENTSLATLYNQIIVRRVIFSTIVVCYDIVIEQQLKVFQYHLIVIFSSGSCVETP